jgi:sugar O-acyltransferase (sialic acid O-acetyltransferase NeuD family)
VKPALILVAASGLAREAVAAVRAADGEREIVGFADDDPRRWGEIYDGVKVLGGLNVVDDHPDAQVLVCAGKGIGRAGLVDRLGLAADRFATVVHPSVTVPASCQIGVGSIVLAGCVLTASVHVGDHVTVMPTTVLTHDDAVADFVTLCAGVVLGGSVRIGARAYLGMSVSVRERVTVGADAVIGMGSVVLADVPAAQTWVGVPARPRSPYL